MGLSPLQLLRSGACAEEALWGYDSQCLCLPHADSICGFLALLVLYPIIANFVISLQADGLWTLKNYQQVFKEPVFAKVAFNTVIWTVGSVVLQLLVGFVLALLLNQDFRGRAFFRSIILVLPWATPDIVVGVAWQWMYNDMYGVLNDILFRLGIIDYYLPGLDQDGRLA